MSDDLDPAPAAPALTPLDVALGEIETLNEALATRTAIGQAIGILMVEKSLTSEDAFAHLVTLSSHTNTKIRDIAESMVAKVERRARGER